MTKYIDTKYTVTMAIFAIAIIICLIVGVVYTTNTKQYKNEYPYQVYRGNIELKLQQSKGLLVDEIDNYIKKVAPTSNINSRVLFELCDDYNIDVKFVLAQGHIESHFGTKGLALKTNSVFNVFAYDGKSYSQICKKGKYSHPDHSIKPYLELLVNDYMVDGKNEYDLLDEFVNKNGDRYASATDYEIKLSNTFNNISDSTQIDFLYKQYKKYQILSGK